MTGSRAGAALRQPAGARRRTPLLLGMLLLATSSAPLGCSSLGTWIMTPGAPFEDYTLPPAPDYDDPGSWAARPGMDSPALDVPDGVAPGDPEWTEQFDVFYLHPTTYFWRFNWVAGIHGWLSDLIVDTTLRNQASIFNVTGRIYAPHYRQLTLAGFEHPEEMEKGLEVAYSDVRRAFQYFLDHWNEGRPLFLVGHSQGSRLLLRLLDEFFTGPPLRDRLVATYPVGTRAVRGPEFAVSGDLPICSEPGQTGCLVSWRTFATGSPEGPQAREHRGRDPRVACVNPLTWKASEPEAPPSANRGSIPMSIFSLPKPEPGMIGAQCADGALWINPPSKWSYDLFAPEGDFHAEDFNLFYMNLREDAYRRARAFRER